jgi:hypothetical protein
MIRLLKIFGKFFLALMGSLFFWQATALGGVLILSFALGLAIAGPGRRVLWSVVAVLISCIPVLVLAFGSALPDVNGNLYFGVMAFGLFPLFPALLLWLANTIRNRRTTAGVSG